MNTQRPRVLFDAGDLEQGPALLRELRRLEVDPVLRLTPGAVLHPENGGPPDLAVLGGGLGEGRVGSLTLLIRERWPRLPLILVSPEIAETMEATPTCRIIPPDPRRLREAVEDLLPQARPAGDPGRPLVLCVDDDVQHLRALSRLIVNHGYRVAPFDNAERAMDRLRELAPDVAILDVKMPGMGGLKMAREVSRAHGERIPVVLLTALGTDEDIARGYHEGASYYLTKPCDPRRVLNILDYLVGDLDPRRRAELETQL